MTLPDSILDLIGNTPMVRVRSFDTGPCTLLVKLESQNPGGSIKDRIGRSMIEAAEREGKIGPGSTLVEATAGNTGLGLALVAASKGYRLTLVIPDKMSQEKAAASAGAGGDDCDDAVGCGQGASAILPGPGRADRPARRRGRFMSTSSTIRRIRWPMSRRTGPEIWEQTDHRLDAVVCGVGSGGTLTGLSRYFAKVAPHVEIVLADPVGSVLADYVRTKTIGAAGSWLVEGIGEDFLPRDRRSEPGLAGLQHLRCRDSLQTVRIAAETGGHLCRLQHRHAAGRGVRYCREQTKPKTVVTFVCDTGSKYLSKMYNDFWMADQGLAGRTDARRSARSHQPAISRGGRGRRGAGRSADCHLRAHAAVRCFAVGGDGRRETRRHRGRRAIFSWRFGATMQHSTGRCGRS